VKQNAACFLERDARAGMLSALRALNLDLEPLRDRGRGPGSTVFEFPSAYQTSELLTGEITYPVLKYDGYGDGVGTDLEDFIGPEMLADWVTHRDALLKFWISGESSYTLENSKPWLLFHGAPGTRPWGWWCLESHPPIGEDETENEYLTRHDLWLPGERELFAAAERALRPDDDNADLTPR
jgi:hypothetical protein